MTNSPFGSLRDSLAGPGRVIIQTHDFPDFDAVAAAFALGALLQDQAPLLYAGGSLDSYSLQEMIRQLKIPLITGETWIPEAEDRIILVDCHPGSGNVNPLPGRIVAAVDHHPGPSGPSATVLDIRTHLGSCSSLVYTYYAEVGQKPSWAVATALMMGLMMDTGFLTRGVSPQDLEAFNQLYFLGDWKLGSYILINSLSVNAVPRFQEALSHLITDRGFGFTWLKEQAGVETVALIADDFMRFHEIHFVAVAAPSGEGWRVSARSDDPLIPAGGVVMKALEGLGTGGGHLHMGGGLIKPGQYPGNQELFLLLRSAIDHFIAKETS